MKNNYEITSLVGNTPLIRLTNIEKIYRTSCKIYAKVESFNLTGSIKDRAVLEILKDLSQKGRCVIIVSHSNKVIEYADKVLNLKEGKLE